MELEPRKAAMIAVATEREIGAEVKVNCYVQSQRELMTIVPKLV